MRQFGFNGQQSVAVAHCPPAPEHRHTPWLPVVGSALQAQVQQSPIELHGSPTLPTQEPGGEQAPEVPPFPPDPADPVLPVAVLGGPQTKVSQTRFEQQVWPFEQSPATPAQPVLPEPLPDPAPIPDGPTQMPSDRHVAPSGQPLWLQSY